MFYAVKIVSRLPTPSRPTPVLVWLFLIVPFLSWPAAAANPEPAPAGGARHGLVKTRDGRKIEGSVKLSGQGFAVANGEETNSVPLTNVLEAAFERPAVATAAKTEGKGTGLLGYYYNNTNLAGAPIVRLDETVQFEWDGQTSPMPGLGGGDFGIRWLGRVEAPRTDTYTFYLGTDDGGRLSVGSLGPISMWHRQEYTETNLTFAMQAGAKYKIRIEYFQSIGIARAKLWWSTPLLPKSIVPREFLYAGSQTVQDRSEITSGQGLVGAYYQSPDLSGPSYSRIDNNINLDWQGAVPAGLMAARNQWLQVTKRSELAEDALRRFRNDNKLPTEETPADQARNLRREFDQRRGHARQELEAAARRFAKAQHERQELERTMARARQRNQTTEAQETALAQARIHEDAAAREVRQGQAAVQTLDQIATRQQALAQQAAMDRRALALISQQLQNASMAFDSNSVAPAISSTFFSVRWTGQILGDKTGPHTFTTQTDEGVRLWINDRLLLDAWDEPTNAQHEADFPLTEGERYDLRMETKNTDGTALARLFWSREGLSNSLVPQPFLFPSRPAGPLEVEDNGDFMLPAGTLLTSGVFIGAPVESADKTSVTFGGFHHYSIPLLKTARILVQPLSPQQAALLEPGRTGVLLANDDFVDGEFMSLKDGVLKISSVLFGLMKWDVATQVNAIVLREAPGVEIHYLVKNHEGNLLLAPDLTLSGDRVLIPQANGLSIPFNQLVQVKRVPPMKLD